MISSPAFNEASIRSRSNFMGAMVSIQESII